MFLDSVLSVFTGGLTGVLGVGIQRVFEFKTKKLELEANRDLYDHQVRMKQADAAIMAQEWAARSKIAEAESATAMDVADSAAFAKSFSMEPQRYSEGHFSRGQNWLMVFLDVFRGVVRPALTVYLCVLTTLIYLKCQTMLDDQAILPDQALDLTKTLVETILYLTTTCILFWFGSRNKSALKK